MPLPTPKHASISNRWCLANRSFTLENIVTSGYSHHAWMNITLTADFLGQLILFSGSTESWFDFYKWNFLMNFFKWNWKICQIIFMTYHQKALDCHYEMKLRPFDLFVMDNRQWVEHFSRSICVCTREDQSIIQRI